MPSRTTEPVSHLNRTALRLGLLALLLGGALRLSTPPVIAEEDAAIQVPVTFDEIWYRQEKKKGMGKLKAYKASGALRVTAQGLEFAAKEKRVFIPVADLRLVSLGKMGRDVDTDWVLVAFEKAGSIEVVGFRDGDKLGYGSETATLGRNLRSLMKLLGAAQYNVPEGYKAFDQPDYQIAFAIPADWSTYVQSMVVVDGKARWGTIVFSSEPDERQLPQSPEAPPAFFLERRETKRGMSCDGFTPKAQAAVLAQIAEDPLFGTGYEIVDSPRVSEITLGRCSGMRLQARSLAADGSTLVLDMRVIAKRDTLYLFGQRSLEQSRNAFLEPFEKSLTTVILSSTRE